jgi:hypothetical protein
MQTDSVQTELLALVRSHESDRDGGYRLATILCEYRTQLSEGDAERWDDVLVSWVREEEPSLSGVALEALSTCGGGRVSVALSALLRQTHSNVEFVEYVAHALIRRGVADDTVRAVVERNAALMRPMGLPNLAALIPILPDVLSVAVECIVAAMSTGRDDYVEANIPPFVHNAADSNLQILVRLVEQVFKRNRQSGLKLAAMLQDYLAKPFVQKELDAQSLSSVSPPGKSKRRPA